jgi:hypothetical protein
VVPAALDHCDGATARRSGNAHTAGLGCFPCPIDPGLPVGGERHLGPTYESLPDLEWPRAEAGFAGLVPGSPASTTSSPIRRLFRLM